MWIFYIVFLFSFISQRKTFHFGEFKIATGMIDDIGMAVGKSHKEIWGTMGEENIKTFSKNHPGFFR